MKWIKKDVSCTPFFLKQFKLRIYFTHAAFIMAASFFLVSGKVATRKMYKLEAAIKKIIAGV